MTQPLSSADINIFSPEINKFCCIKKYIYRLKFNRQFLILLIFLESLVIALINMDTILVMSAKIFTPGLRKIRLFWNNGYDVILFVHGVTNKRLSRDSNHIIYVVMWPKIGNCSIFMRKVIITSILWGFDQKNRFF